MQLTRIRLQQFRQFRQPIEIAALAPGINLFSGPNEAGKSTIVAAIRAAFFERHRSSSVDDLRPWGEASATPTVELDFTVAGQPYRLVKSFLGKKRCTLQIGTRVLDGALAEDHLAELLGFQHAGRGASTAEHWGIPGLLWIAQGTGHDVREAVGHAAGPLRTALNASLGEVASSGGDAVLAEVEALRHALLTPAGGQPRGAYADALKRQSQLQDNLQQTDTAIATYRQRVDQLATLRRDHAADAAQQPWLAFRAQEQAAREVLVRIDRLQQTLAADRQRATQLDTQARLLRERVAGFAEQDTRAAARAVALQTAQAAASSAGSAVVQWETKTAQAVAAYEAARRRLREARDAQTRARLADEVDSLAARLSAGDASLSEAEQVQTRWQAAQQQVAATEIDAEALRRLRATALRRRELQIQRDAVATRLRFDLAEGAGITLDGEAVEGRGERLLLAATRLQLGALGSLHIAPGGADLADQAREAATLDDTVAALLRQLGVPSPEAADERQQQHTAAQAELRTVAATLKALAPKGIETLRSEQAARGARLAEQRAALAELPESGPALPQPPAVSDAETAEEAARRTAAEVEAGLAAARLAAGNAQARCDAAAAEHALAEAALRAPERAQQLAAAQRALVDALAEGATLAAQIETRAGEIAQARPDILQQDVARFKASADQLAQAFEDRKNALLRIEMELDSAGAQGLDEQRAGLQRDLDQLQRRVDEFRRRAAALDHLLQLMKDQRGALTRRLQAPLQKHLQRYLQLLFPDASLEIDDHLAPGPLTRNGSSVPQTGPFDALSFGAREQMGLISRLAYADLLKEAGRPTLLILDDALVHSDAHRLAQMKRILFDAATRHQVLLFTCHPLQWRDLGAVERSIESFKGAVG